MAYLRREQLHMCMRALSTTLGFLVILAGLGGTVRAQATPPSFEVADPSEFVVRAGDVLRIRVWPDEALGGEFPIEESGFVLLPLLGEVRAGGTSLGALRRLLRQRYAQVINTPVVSVTPLFRVSAIGAVTRPGLYQVDPSHSLFDVISLAGGFRQDAAADKMRVIRGDRVLEINAEQALVTGEALLALALQSGDRIVVPRRRNFFTAQNISFMFQAVVLTVTIISLTR